MEPALSSFYKVEQIAQIMQVTEETVRVWLKRKKNPLPYYRVGREYRIRVSDFEAWLASQKNPQEQ
ncbi:MAG TPA: helix-turn-helix domain-containing protein [Ktedonobacteraceae bacterium]|nr:helix-turn-helix domain-containing protein [Ktedonobacteraceae bacterium]